MRLRRVAHPRRRLATIAARGLLLLVVVLALAQLLLPRLASKVIKDRVSRYGSVRSASVDAFPAVELLWGEAASATVDARNIAISPEQLVPLLFEASGVERLHVDADSFELQGLHLAAAPLRLAHASLRKRGASLQASALLTPQALQASLPSGLRAEILRSSAGQVNVRVTGSLFGLKTTVQAIVKPVEGKLELEPAGSLLRGLASVTLLDEPRLRILAVAATARPHGSWELRVQAELR